MTGDAPDYETTMSSDPGREAATAVEMWSRRVTESGGRTAFKSKEGGAWRSVTWADAHQIALEIAAGLAQAGVHPGDRVCLLAQTRVEWMLCDVAILLLGAITVPIYASNTPEQCAFILRDCGAGLVIVEDAAQLEKVIATRAELPALSRFVHIAGDAILERPDSSGRTRVALAEVRPPGDAAFHSLDELRATGRAHPLPADELARRAATLSPASLFTIIYTSGTTGTPKGVVLSHRNLTSALASACRAMILVPDDQQLLFLPMAHVLGREMAWVAVQAGFVTWFAESIGKVKDNLVEARPTFIAGVPRIYEKFYSGVQKALAGGAPLKRKLAAWALGVGRRTTEALQGGEPLGGTLAFAHAVADRLVFSTLRKRLGLDRARFLLSGAAPLTPEIAEFFHGVGLLILEGYGLTETVGAAFLNPLAKVRFGTVGTAFDVVEVKIAEDGEILMRGPSIFSQYYNNPEATAEAVDGGGWFHSGDIGQLEDGYLRITDRKKDLIVTAGGKKVAPQPLENAIKMRTPLVSQAVVFGDKRPYCVALLTPSEEALKRFGAADGTVRDPAPLRAEIDKAIAALNAGLASYESIKAYAILPVDFSEAAGELTPSLKVKRKVVSDRYREVIEGLYQIPRPAA